MVLFRRSRWEGRHGKQCLARLYTKHNKLKLQRRRMAQSAGIGSKLDLVNYGRVKESERVPEPANAVITSMRRKKSIVVRAHSGTARLEARATPPLTKQISRPLSFHNWAHFVDEWPEKKKAFHHLHLSYLPEYRFFMRRNMGVW